jgi:hypothetical protein
MSTVQPNYLFLNAVQAAGADVTVSEGMVTFGTSTNISPSIKLRNISNIYTKTPGAAAVARVQTVTITTPVDIGTDYSFQITQLIGNVYQTVFVSYQSVAGDTGITVATALTSVVSALISSGSIQLASAANSATNVITLTGSSSNPLFVTEALETGTGLVVATSTAGNEAFGVGSDLIADGITGISAQPVSTNLYSLAVINYYSEANSLNAQKRDIEQQLYVYVNDGDGDAAAFFTAGIAAKLTTITTLAPAGLAASVEALP